MRIAQRWVVLLLECAACSLSTTTYQGGGDDAGDAGTTAPNDPHGGTRLQLNRYVFETESRIAGVHDAVLNMDCVPAAWSDGKQRCTPSAQTFVAYGDAACTQLIGVDGGGPACGGTQPGFVIDQSTGVEVSHLYPRGAALAGTSWYSNQSGVCQLQSTAGYQLYALGPEIAPDTLAEVTIDQTPIGAFSVAIVHSADGLQWQQSNLLMHDDTYNMSCYLYPSGNRIVCNPYPVAESSVFTDAQCTSPEAVVSFQPTLPVTLVRDGIDACTGASYSRLGDPALPSSLWALDNTSTCMATTANPSSMYYTIGAPAPLASFTSVSTTTAARIQSTQLVSGPLHVDDTLYDSKLGVACSPFRSADGTVRCLPLANIQSVFTDSNCLQAIDVIAVFRSSTCVEPVVPTYVTGFGSCAVDGHKVGQRYTGPIYSSAGSMCQLFDSGLEYYLATTQVPDDTFATGTFTTGP